MREQTTGNDRAVSEVVGFILVFSLVLITIALVYTSGMGGLTDARDAEQMNNAERAFDVLAYNFEKMVRGEAPHRATEVKLADSTLAMEANTQIRVKNESGDTITNMTQHQPISYEVGSGSQVVYEHGAVIRVDDGHATMKRNPDLLFANDRLVFRYIEAGDFGGDGQRISGDTTVLVRASVTSSQLLYTSSDETVTIELETNGERVEAWKRYFEENGGDCNSPSGEGQVTLECEFETEYFQLSRTRIQIEFT